MYACVCTFPSVLLSLQGSLLAIRSTFRGVFGLVVDVFYPFANYSHLLKTAAREFWWSPRSGLYMVPSIVQQSHGTSASQFTWITSFSVHCHDGHPGKTRPDLQRVNWIHPWTILPRGNRWGRWDALLIIQGKFPSTTGLIQVLAASPHASAITSQESDPLSEDELLDTGLTNPIQVIYQHSWAEWNTPRIQLGFRVDRFYWQRSSHPLIKLYFRFRSSRCSWRSSFSSPSVGHHHWSTTFSLPLNLSENWTTGIWSTCARHLRWCRTLTRVSIQWCTLSCPKTSARRSSMRSAPVSKGRTTHVSAATTNRLSAPHSRPTLQPSQPRHHPTNRKPRLCARQLPATTWSRLTPRKLLT